MATASMTSDGATPPFERIVADYGPLISRIAMSYEADPGHREDLIQQILLAVWQALPTYRADAALKTFVARIAQNRAISHVAHQVHRGPVAEFAEERFESDQPSPEQSAIRASERQRLIEATRSLPLPQRQVIIPLLEGFSYAEIAEMLNIAPNAVATRLNRAKAALQAMLEQPA